MRRVFPALTSTVQTLRLHIQTLKAVCGVQFRGPNSLYLKPKTLDEAISLLASPGGQILAGGTDFYPALGERLPQGRVVDITALGELLGHLHRERMDSDRRADDMERCDSRHAAAMFRCAQGGGAGSRVGADSEPRYGGGEPL